MVPPSWQHTDRHGAAGWEHRKVSRRSLVASVRSGSLWDLVLLGSRSSLIWSRSDPGSAAVKADQNSGLDQSGPPREQGSAADELWYGSLEHRWPRGRVVVRSLLDHMRFLLKGFWAGGPADGPSLTLVSQRFVFLCLCRHCWVCFATEQDDVSAEWVSPCRCKGCTKWIHQTCLQRWLDEKQRSNATGGVSCPQCGTQYHIVFPKMGEEEPPPRRSNRR